MKPDNELFTTLDPPKNGVATMQRKLEAASARRILWHRTMAVTSIAGSVLLILSGLYFVQRQAGPVNPPLRTALSGELAESPGFARLLGRELQPIQLAVVVDEREVQVTALQSSDPRIKIYRIDPQ